MSKYFKNVKSFSDLKSQFKVLLKANHPDNGGDAEVMKEINAEYDVLFSVWKNRQEEVTGTKVNETADGTRSEFYTEFGWKGKNYDYKRSLKEVAQIVRAYIKEKYPTYKFRVYTHYASMCEELHVELKESPIEIYKTADQLTRKDKDEFFRIANRNGYWVLTCWTEEEFKAEYTRIVAEHGRSFAVLNETTKAVIEDVDAFVHSYNYSDCDGRIDYFNVGFWYFGCCQANGCDVKIVPKVAKPKRTRQAARQEKTDATKPAEAAKPEETRQPERPEAEEQKPQEAEAEAQPEVSVKAAQSAQEPQEEPKKKSGYTYRITRGEDTRDGSVLWIVRVEETLDRAAYKAVEQAMRKRGAYYSRFLHGFLFRFDPTTVLQAA